ncbi:hypothetical protein MRT22_27595, partial [Escherichia coli]|uniref:Sir2 family NAD-dependent protein deacetylase n=1 Tax=Escherichia coli TaxID=562 RepID=UPI0024184F06
RVVVGRSVFAGCPPSAGGSAGQGGRLAEAGRSTEAERAIEIAHADAVRVSRRRRGSDLEKLAGADYNCAMTNPPVASPSLQDFVGRHKRLFVLTGAGCSTNSGIPDYRDSAGNWKRTQPVNFQAFMAEEQTRQRYWARSLIG